VQLPGIFDDNVTTTSVSVQPKTTYNSNDGTSRTIGYTFTNRLSVKIGSLTGDLLSSVLDTAVQNGGNNLTISSVSFDLFPGLSYNKTVDARSQAARDAKTTAEQYAKVLTTKISLSPPPTHLLLFATGGQEIVSPSSPPPHIFQSQICL